MSHPLLAFRNPMPKIVTGVVSLVDTLPTAAPGISIMVNDVKLTCTDIVAKGKDFLATVDALNAARTNVANLVAKQKAQRAEMKDIVAGVKAWVIANFGKTSAILATLGFVITKRKQPTPEQKAQAKVKAKATRDARHTMGKVQKKAIKGTPPAPPAPPATGTGTPPTGTGH